LNSSALDLRPTKWSEVIGHVAVVASLQKLLTQATPSVVGFSGEAGTGKTTLGLIFADAVNGGPVLDIEHINCGDKNGVDDARALAEEAKFRPLMGRRKVRILDECHMMTVNAQNALLIPTEPATGQEPTTLWIFCTTQPENVLPALRGRGVWYSLKGFEESEIKQLYTQLSVRKTDKGSGQFPEELFQEVLRKGVDNPRELCYVYDKWKSGCSAAESVAGINVEIEYVEIAQAALKSWKAVAPLLKSLKANDAKPLKRLLASWMRTVLCNSSTPQACAEFLVRLASQDAYEDSVTLAAVCADIFLLTQKLATQK
jgi:hypothetical protein